MYADDIVVISETKEGLQKCLTKLGAYTKKWDLQLNPDKTKIIVFQKYGKKDTTIFKCGNYLLGNSKNYKYLGTLISSNGNFKSNEVHLRKKGLG